MFGVDPLLRSSRSQFLTNCLKCAPYIVIIIASLPEGRQIALNSRLAVKTDLRKHGTWYDRSPTLDYV